MLVLKVRVKCDDYGVATSLRMPTSAGTSAEVVDDSGYRRSSVIGGVSGGTA